MTPFLLVLCLGIVLYICQEFEYKTVWEEDANLTKRVVVVCTL